MAKSKYLSAIKMRRLAVFFALVLLALIATVPGFFHVSIAIPIDGRIHTARFNQIYQSLRHFELPSMISFIGQSHHLSAMSGMYPWLTGIIFILPQFVIHNSLHALAAGIFLLNLMTGWFAYVLVKNLTKREDIHFLFVVLYLFNAYHLTLVFSRMALGEALAYAFWPLVLLGILRVWQMVPGKHGELVLGVGMAGIANSHVLSLLIGAFALVLVELVRLVLRKVSLQEAKQLLIAGVVGILGSIYSLGQIAYLMLNNKMASPFRAIIALDPYAMFTDTVRNSIEQNATAWNLGIVLSVLLVILNIGMFKRSGLHIWKMFTLLSDAILVVSFNWIPWPKLLSTPMSLLQFNGRLLTFVVVLALVAFTFYLNEFYNKSGIVLFSAAIFAVFLGVCSVINLEITDHSEPEYYRVNSDDFLQTAYDHSDVSSDYLPEFKKGNSSSVLYDYPKNSKLLSINTQYNGATYSVSSTTNGMKVLPLPVYRKLDYTVKVNGRNSAVINHRGYMKLLLTKGINKVHISVATPSVSKVLFVINIVFVLVMILSLIILL